MLEKSTFFQHLPGVEYSTLRAVEVALEAAKDFAVRMENTRADAASALRHANKVMKTFYNAK